MDALVVRNRSNKTFRLQLASAGLGQGVFQRLSIVRLGERYLLNWRRKG